MHYFRVTNHTNQRTEYKRKKESWDLYRKRIVIFEKVLNSNPRKLDASAYIGLRVIDYFFIFVLLVSSNEIAH